MMSVVDKVTMGQGFSQSTAVLPLSVTFHQRFIIVFLSLLLVSKGEPGDA